MAIAKAAVTRFELSTDVLAFDTTNFDTFIATLTPASWRVEDTPRASEGICAWWGWACWSARRGTCRCCIGPMPATARIRRC